jgi:hypothetical protein
MSKRRVGWWREEIERAHGYYGTEELVPLREVCMSENIKQHVLLFVSQVNIGSLHLFRDPLQFQVKKGAYTLV